MKYILNIKESFSNLYEDIEVVRDVLNDLSDDDYGVYVDDFNGGIYIQISMNIKQRSEFYESDYYTSRIQMVDDYLKSLSYNINKSYIHWGATLIELLYKKNKTIKEFNSFLENTEYGYDKESYDNIIKTCEEILYPLMDDGVEYKVMATAYLNNFIRISIGDIHNLDYVLQNYTNELIILKEYLNFNNYILYTGESHVSRSKDSQTIIDDSNYEKKISSKNHYIFLVFIEQNFYDELKYK